MNTVQRAIRKRHVPQLEKTFVVIESKGLYSEYNHEFDDSDMAIDYAVMMEQHFQETVWLVGQNCP